MKQLVLSFCLLNTHFNWPVSAAKPRLTQEQRDYSTPKLLCQREIDPRRAANGRRVLEATAFVLPLLLALAIEAESCLRDNLEACRVDAI